MLRDLHEGITAHEKGRSAKDPVTGTWCQLLEPCDAFPAIAFSSCAGHAVLLCVWLVLFVGRQSAGEMVPPPKQVQAELGGQEVLWKLDHFTHHELRKVLRTKSKRSLLHDAGCWVFMCVAVLSLFLTLTIIDLKVRACARGGSGSR